VQNYSKIGAIEKPGFGGAASKVTIQADGKTVLPGLVDIHVHLRDPGLDYKEDFRTGTMAAAAGGVTTVLDMPNNLPPITTGERFAQKRGLAAQKAIVDYGLYASASGVEHYENFAAQEAIGLKLYMEEAHRKGSPYGSELTVTDDGQVWEIFCRAAKVGLPVAVHLDTASITRKLRDELSHKEQTWEHYYTLQNSIATEVALAKLLVMSEASGADLHVSHVLSIGCLRRVKEAKDAGKRFTADCIVPALSLDDMMRLGPYAIPLGRPDEENKLFWKMLSDSVLDCVITDHAPHSKEEKDQGWSDIWSSPPGAPGLETVLGILLTRVHDGLMDLHEVVRMACLRPAEVVGIRDRKGSIEEGKDADLVIVDLEEKWKVLNDQLNTKCGWSPFDGQELVGRPKMTILRGNVIMEDSKVVGTAGYGTYIMRAG
jgi:dihydroorotase (multifunctional complex type)